jgi:hypothetical protein
MDALELKTYLEQNNLLLVDKVALENFTRDVISESRSNKRVWIDTREACRLLNTNRQALSNLVDQPFTKLECRKSSAGKTAKIRYRLDTVFAEIKRIQLTKKK